MSYLSSAQVAEKIGTTPGNLRLMRLRGKFPAPDLAPSRQVLLWAVTTVDQWLEENRDRLSSDQA